MDFNIYSKNGNDGNIEIKGIRERLKTRKKKLWLSFFWSKKSLKKFRNEITIELIRNSL